MADYFRESYDDRVWHFDLFGRRWCLKVTLRVCGSPHRGWHDVNASWIAPLDRDADPRWPFFLMKTYRKAMTKDDAIAEIRAAYAN